jgi:hypothetical protein
MYLKYFLKHYYEMLKGHIKSLFLKLYYPQKYFYLNKIRGNYFLLFKTKLKLYNKIKYLLKINNISNYIIISRIKTIYSLNRKYIYSKIIKKKANYTDSIGFKIITKNRNDCYKIMNILINNFKLKKKYGIINPEDFFKTQKFMRKTNSICKNQIFVKIIYNGCNIHFILIPKNNLEYIYNQRNIYIDFINTTIKNNK